MTRKDLILYLECIDDKDIDFIEIKREMDKADDSETTPIPTNKQTILIKMNQVIVILGSDDIKIKH